MIDECGVLTPTGPCGIEGEHLPTCRRCGEHVCPAHVVPFSLKEHHFDLEGDGDHGPEATMTQSVLCTACERAHMEAA